MQTSRECVDRLLERWSQGDRAALEELTPLVYGELHAIKEFSAGSVGARSSHHWTELRVDDALGIDYVVDPIRIHVAKTERSRRVHLVPSAR